VLSTGKGMGQEKRLLFLEQKRKWVTGGKGNEKGGSTRGRRDKEKKGFLV